MISTTVLTIAGSDSSGGAGLQADLKTFGALGVHGACAVTALTAQNTMGVSTWEAVSSALVRAQIRAVLGDLEVVAAKTGMLASPEIVHAVADELTEHPVENLVCDPVLVSTAGNELFAGDVVVAIREHILPLTRIVTPNTTEAAALTGRTIRSIEDAEEAGEEILDMGAGAVLITGGHLEESPATDVLVTRSEVRRFAGTWIDTDRTHGTGCTISAAIAAYLGLELSIEEAVERSKRFVTRALAHGVRIGRGAGSVDPAAGRRALSDSADSPERTESLPGPSDPDDTFR